MDHSSGLSLLFRAFPNLFHGGGTGHTKMSDCSRTLASIYFSICASQLVRSGQVGPVSYLFLYSFHLHWHTGLLLWHSACFAFFQARGSQKLPLTLSRHREYELFFIRTLPHFSLWDKTSGDPEPVALCPHLVATWYGSLSSSTGSPTPALMTIWI